MKNKKLSLLLIIATIFNSNFAQVLPLVNTTWNQGCYYNADCPAGSGGPCGKTYTGCNATALAQIMKYYNHPSSSWGGSYTNTGTPVQTVNFSSATYNWAAMPNSLSSSNVEVAKIMYNAGVAVDMQYSTTVSNSYFNSALLKKFFKYSLSLEFVMKGSYSNTDWENLLKNELNNGRLVYVKSSTHFYIVDGYQVSPTLKFHCNFGWGGVYDGYYDIHNVVAASTNFTPGTATIGIKPLLNLEASPDTIVLTASGGSANFEIASLNNWTASSNQGWCVPTTTSGNAGYIDFSNGAVATISSNSTYSVRFATITVTDGTTSANVVIKQTGITPYVSVNPNNLTFSSASSSQNVSITSDSNWVASTADSWIGLAPLSGIGAGSLTITPTANGPTSRAGTVIITRGNKQASISVFQAASGSFWCVPAMTTTGSNGITNVTLKSINRTSPNNEAYIITGIGTTLKIDTTYNISVTFIGSNAPAIWIDWNIDGDFNDPNEAVMPGSGSWYPSFAGTKNLNFAVPSFATEGLTRMRVYAKNFGTGPVSGACNTSDIGGDIEDYDITILNHNHILVNPITLTYLNSGGTQNINVVCDSIWNTNTSAPWISVLPNSGSGNGMVGITTSVNTALSTRTDIVTFTRGSKSKTVSVSQDAADTILFAGPTPLNFLNTGGINSFNVNSNVSYTITSNQTWITPDLSTSSGNAIVNVNVANNPTNLIRAGTITVWSGNFSQVITINQDSTSSILLVSPSALNFPWNGGMLNTSITSPSSWNASTSASWFSLNQNSGTGNFNLDVSCDTNFTASSRTGNVTISNGVISTQVIIHQDSNSVVTSVTQLDSEYFNLYPNPAEDVIYLKMNGNKNSFSLGEIFSITGQKILDFKLIPDQPTKVVIKELVSGLYYFVIRNSSGLKYYFKFIKE